MIDAAHDYKNKQMSKLRDIGLLKQSLKNSTFIGWTILKFDILFICSSKFVLISTTQKPITIGPSCAMSLYRLSSCISHHHVDNYGETILFTVAMHR